MNQIMKIRKIFIKKLFTGALFALCLSSTARAALDIPLPEALDTEASSLVWTTGGSSSWIGQSNVNHDGVDAAESGPTPDAGSSYVETIVTGPGTFSFWWKVSSEANNDRLRCMINGVEQARISGEVSWQTQSFPVSAGNQVLRIVYQKDSSVSAGQDRAWIDQVQFTPQAVPTNCPITISPTNGTFNAVEATGLVNVTTSLGCAWTVTNTNAWIAIVSGASGSGSGTVRYQVVANGNSTARTANLLIAGQPFTVTQSGGACSYALSSSTANFSSAPSTGLVSIVTLGGCAWTAINTNPWIVVVSGSNGSGSRIIRYDVAANSGNSRSGNFLIAGQLFSVSQAGAPHSGDPVIMDQPFNQSVLVGGTATFSVSVSNMNGYQGVNGYVYAAVSDGSSNLYVGGNFNIAGHVTANRIAKWNGNNWSALGSGMDGVVSALAISGNDLYAAGSFTTAGGITANSIAKWDGTNWSALGSGMDGSISALAKIGSDLYAGGGFTNAGGLTANRIARWNGSNWTPVGSGMNRDVVALAVSGGDLYAGGFFTNAGGIAANRIARWNGSNWSPLGSGMDREVNALAVSGSVVYAGGSFFTADGLTVNRIAKWDESNWSGLGSGMNLEVDALAVSGSDLYAGGKFITAGGIGAGALAKWNGNSWSAVSSGMNGELVDAVDPFVRALTVSGSDLFAGGGFLSAGGIPAICIAKWNGNDWSGLRPPPIQLQWQFNGVNLTNGGGISGAFSTTLVLNNVQSSQAGNYRVIVSSTSGTLLSSSAVLSVSPCAVTFSPSNRTHSAASQRAIVNVSVPQGCEWGIVNTNAWISSIPHLDGVSNFVEYTVTENTGASSRNGALVIGGSPFVVIQMGTTNVACTYSVSPANRAHGYGAASNVMTVTTAANCPWSVINTNPWIMIPITSGSGNALLSYFVTANGSTFSRSGYVAVANKSVFISQAGGSAGTNSGSCTITLSPGNRTHDFSGSTGMVTVSTASNCAWNVVETNGWISIITPTNNTGNGTVVYLVSSNSSATARAGNIVIGGQVFALNQGVIPPPLSATPLIIAPIEVTNIGHLFNAGGVTNGLASSLVQDFLIDQDRSSGGGAELPGISVNWDTNWQFNVTLAAPAGKKFAVEVPTGARVGFSGYLWWESTRGGFSPKGTAAVQFEDLEGTAPDLSEATAVLSDSHGYFGFLNLEGTTVSNRFAFTSMTLTGLITPKFTGEGSEDYIPHLESALRLFYLTSETNDPGSFVFLVPTGPMPRLQLIGASPETGVELIVYGNPKRTHIVQCSGDTVAWTQIASGVMPPAGSMHVRDASKTSAAISRFYRVIELP